jgi:hypothetical protein
MFISQQDIKSEDQDVETSFELVLSVRTLLLLLQLCPALPPGADFRLIESVIVIFELDKVREATQG